MRFAVSLESSRMWRAGLPPNSRSSPVLFISRTAGRRRRTRRAKTFHFSEPARGIREPVPQLVAARTGRGGCLARRSSQSEQHSPRMSNARRWRRRHPVAVVTRCAGPAARPLVLRCHPGRRSPGDLSDHVSPLQRRFVEQGWNPPVGTGHEHGHPCRRVIRSSGPAISRHARTAC